MSKNCKRLSIIRNKAKNIPGGMRDGFNYFRAFPEDAIQNMNYSKTKLTMPILISSRSGIYSGFWRRCYY
ncbi:MAG: hypothetical protein WA421_07860 [Nitrososphaeraceae archaeon]